MNKSNYSLEVQINGRPVREFYKEGRAFIEGREGTKYTLKFRNNSWKRVLAVFSVDGIEVIEGKVASEFKGGYIIDPFSSIEIKGYRIDEKSVAAFMFAKTHKSYSNTTGGAEVNEVTGEVEYTKTTRNNGVIGVRVFEEKVKDHNYEEQYKVFNYTTNSAFLPISGCSYSGHPIAALSGCVIQTRGTRTFYPVHGVSVGPTYATGYAYALNNINSTVNGTFKNESVTASATTASNLLPTRSYEQHEVLSYYSSNTKSNINQMGQLSAIPREISPPPVAPDFNLGTTWGEKVEDKVKQVTFEKTETYVDLEIYYDSRESLAAFGVDFEVTKQYVKWPSAFEDKKKFCKVPEGYNG